MHGEVILQGPAGHAEDEGREITGERTDEHGLGIFFGSGTPPSFEAQAEKNIFTANR